MVAVRAAIPGDVDAVNQVGRRTWPSTYTNIAGADYVARGLARWWSHDGTLSAIEAGRVAVAVIDDAIVGMASVGPGDGFRIIWKLYVMPDQQGAGCGSALLAHVIDAARADGETAIRLEYLDGNERAARFYAAKGFREVSREPDRDGGPDRVWVELRLDG